MKTKLISSFLIDCLLIQIVLINEGCSSFYSTGGNQDIETYSNYEGDVLLKMKDNSEIQVPRDGFYQVGKGKIDSVEIVNYKSNKYQILYMNDRKHFALRMDTAMNISTGPEESDWLVLNSDNSEYLKISRNDIADILIKKTDPLKTGLLIGAIYTALIIAANAQSKKYVYNLNIKIPYFPVY